MSIPTAEETNRQTDVDGLIRVEIIYARPEGVWRRQLQIAASSTVQQALVLSRFFDEFPDWNSETVQVGIYGQQCTLDRVLNNHDRIEIYRPLVFDPMESRRRRALHRQRTAQQGKMSHT